MLFLDIQEMANKDKLSYEDIHKVFAALYKLEYNPVAIKFFFNQEEYDDFVAEKIPGPKMTFCQIALASRMDDYIVKAGDDKLLCGNARTVFGFRAASDEEVNDHLKYTNDWDLAKECLKTKPKLSVGELKGFMTSPLYKTPVKPDVLFLVVNVFQAYHIMTDYAAALKIPSVTSTHTVNSAVCGGAVGCYVNNSADMKTMCAGSFTSGKTEKGEINVFIPGDHIELVARQLLKRSLSNGNSSLLGSGNQAYPGVDVCKQCPMVRFKDYEK